MVFAHYLILNEVNIFNCHAFVKPVVLLKKVCREVAVFLYARNKTGVFSFSTEFRKQVLQRWSTRGFV